MLLFECLYISRLQLNQALTIIVIVKWNVCGMCLSQLHALQAAILNNWSNPLPVFPNFPFRMCDVEPVQSEVNFMLLATTSKTHPLVYEEQVFCSTNTVNILCYWRLKKSTRKSCWRLQCCGWVEKYGEMMGDPSPLQLLLTVQREISRYYLV